MINLKATLALAHASFQSTTRSRLSVAVLLFGVALLGFTSLMTSSSLHEEARLMCDLGLFLGSLIACLSALVLSAQSLYRDLERKSLFTIATKPVSRGVIIWGKFLGISMTSGTLVLLMASAWYALAWRMSVPLDSVMIQAWVLVWVESIVVGAIAMFFGSFSTPLLASTLAFGVMFVGRFGEEIIALNERAMRLGKPNMGLSIAEWLTPVVPPLHLYNITEEVVYGVNLPIAYTVKATLTGVTYCIICLTLASLIFSRRDLT